jgi:hypothetical protein
MADQPGGHRVEHFSQREAARRGDGDDAERPALQPLPGQRTCDHEETVDRLDVFIGGTLLMTLARGRASAAGKHAHVVDYRHVIHALRRKPMALLNLVYRDQLFPREADRLTFERLLEKIPEKSACRLMVNLLALAHERACEAELATLLTADLAAAQLPDHHRAARTLRAGSRRASRDRRPSHAADRLRGASRCRHGRGGMTQNIDGARLTLMLNDLRLPAIKQDWSGFAERADRESWPAARFLATLAEHEIGVASPAILPKHSFCQEKPSTASTLTWCR